MNPTAIVRRDPPVPSAERPAAPTTPLDFQIMAVLADGDHLQLREIVRRVDDTTHHVHARLRELVDRGLVVRTPVPGGPARGPGASRYHLAGA